MALVRRNKTRNPGVSPAAPTIVEPIVPIPAAFAKKTKRKSSALSLAVTALVVPGLFATVALPAYAFAPQASPEADAVEQVQELKESNAQDLVVADAAAGVSIARDNFTATSAAEIAETQRAALAAAYASYTGPTASDYLTNPPYPNFDLAQVAAVAQQYEGVPYRYGGADPSGFDCSGLIMFVYAQFGIILPHSVSGQAALGTPISRDAALPGDIVTMSGHNGIYLGNGMFIDAPDFGRSVEIRAIWTDDYYIYRLGI